MQVMPEAVVRHFRKPGGKSSARDQGVPRPAGLAEIPAGAHCRRVLHLHAIAAHKSFSVNIPALDSTKTVRALGLTDYSSHRPACLNGNCTFERGSPSA